MKTLLRALAGAWLAILLATPARAIVLYDNLTASGGFNDSVGQAVDIGHLQGYQWLAGGSGKLTDIYVGVGRESGEAPLLFLLYADAGNAPGALLEGFAVASANVPAQGSGDLLHFAALGTTAINSGAAYWLLAGTGFAEFSWDENLTGDVGPRYANGNIQDGQTLGALRVVAAEAVTARAPEPVSLALVGIALAGLGLSRRRARA